MAIAQLFFRKPNLIGTIELDVIIQEGATASARITKNPVENGADINDHIIIDPMVFTMSGVVSDIKTSIIGSIGLLNSVESVISTFTRTNTPSKEAWDELLLLHAERTPFELVTNIKTYENVVIQSLTETQDKDTSNALFFSATLTEIILVGEKAQDANQFNDSDVADKAISTVNGGQQSLGEL